MKTAKSTSKTDASAKADDIVGSENRIVFLRGHRTTLRPPMESDVPLLMKWINDPEVRINLGSQTPKRESDEREFVQAVSKSKGNIVLIIEVDGKPIGTMGLHGIKYPDATATTGAMIGEKAYWNKGYGTDAKMALLEYAFNTLGLRRIKSEVIAFNKRSLAYSAHCGYVVEGIKKKEVYRGGKFHDLTFLAATRKSWMPFFKKWKDECKKRRAKVPLVARSGRAAKTPESAPAKRHKP